MAAIDPQLCRSNENVAARREFSTVPVRIFDDPRPSALDFRTLACVSMHDGMSLKKGTGRGCYATYATLSSEIGCDITNLSKSLKRLVDWGYLSEERQEDRRRKTYRVIFDAENSWRNDQQSTDQKLGEITNQIVGEPANEPPEIVGNGESENGRNPPQIEQHYSSLKELDLPKEELDIPKEKLNSVKTALPVLKVDPRLSDRVNLDELERALRSRSPVDRIAWYNFLMCVEGPIGLEPRAQEAFNTLCSRMTVHEMHEARTKYWADRRQREANAERRRAEEVSNDEDN